MALLKLNDKHIGTAAITTTVLWAAASVIYFTPEAIPGKIAIPVGVLAISSLWMCPWQITIGLLLSSSGDYMGSCGQLMGQMISFAAAHLFYIWFFIRRYFLKVEHDRKLTNKAKGYLAMVIFCAISLLGMACFRIAPGAEVGAIRIGVYIYAILICIMMISALLQRSSLYALGAVLFVFSDFILAWDMFVEHIPHSNFLLMIPYFLAQWLLYIRSTSFRVGPEMRLMRF